MTLRPSCPPCAGTTAGSGQPAGESQTASTRTKVPSLRAEAIPRLSPRVDAGSPRAGAGPSARALPTGGRGQGRGHATGPGCRRRRSAAEVRHGEQVEQGGAEREAEKKTSTAPGIALPFMAFQHRGQRRDLLRQSRRPLAGWLRERGKARLQPGNPFTQLCHWVSKAAGCAASAASWGAAAVLAASSREATISASGSSSSSMGGDHHISLPSRRTGGAHGTWKQTLAWRPPSARRVPGRAVPPWPRTSARPSAAMPPRR